MLARAHLSSLRWAASIRVVSAGPRGAGISASLHPRFFSVEAVKTADAVPSGSASPRGKLKATEQLKPTVAAVKKDGDENIQKLKLKLEETKLKIEEAKRKAAAKLKQAKNRAKAMPRLELKPPKRPLSPFFVFLSDFKKDNPHLGIFGPMGKAAGKAWKELTPEQAAVYHERSKADRERYAAEYAEYKQNIPESDVPVLRKLKMLRKLKRKQQPPMKVRPMSLFMKEYIANIKAEHGKLPMERYIGMLAEIHQAYKALPEESRKTYEDEAARLSEERHQAWQQAQEAKEQAKHAPNPNKASQQ